MYWRAYWKFQRHELESEDPSSLESGHVTFDDALNEAYEVGTGVEIRLNNENVSIHDFLKFLKNWGRITQMALVCLFHSNT